MSSVPTLYQNSCRTRTDADLVDNTPTWLGVEAGGSYPGLDVNFRVRFHISNSGAASAAGPFVLRSSKNNAAYAAVTTSSTGGIQSANASSSADEAVINTARLAYTPAANTTGVYDETGSLTKTLAISGICELEYGVILKSANLAATDVVELRLYNSTTAFTGQYRGIPQYCVPEAAGTNFAPDKNLGSSGTYVSTGNASYALISTQAVSTGKLVVVCYAVDNNTATNATDENACTSMSDSAGNTYTKAKEYTASQGLGATDGVTTGLWYCVLTNAISVGTTITANFSNSTNRDAVAMTARSWTVGGSVSVEASNQLATVAGGNPSLDATTSNVECLRIMARGYEWEMEAIGARLHPTGWSAFNDGQAAGGLGATGVLISGFAKISTGTSDTCDPAEPSSGTYDSASVYVAFKVADTEDNPLANDVISTSSVSPAPQLRQEQAVLANDVKSNSSVSQPALAIVVPQVALLANDVISASSVSQSAAIIRRDILANDVKSNSSVGNPAVKQLQGLLANDIVSPSSVGQPAVKSLHGLLANDVKSNSSVSQPAAQQRQGLLANDVLSASSVSQPVVHQAHGLLANDVISASFVSNPAAAGPGGILADDIVSTSKVTVPGLLQGHGLDASEVKSPSSVTSPALVEIAGSVEQALFANDVLSGSSVSQPMLDRPEVVIPPQPEIGGGAGGGGGGYPGAWQREFDRRRAREEGLTLREYLKRVEAAPLPRNKDQKAVDKASRTVREALGRAEAVPVVDYGSRFLETLGEAASAAGGHDARMLVRQMQMAEQAALEFLVRMSEAELQRQAEEIERMLYDDALATVLLLSA